MQPLEDSHSKTATRRPEDQKTKSMSEEKKIDNFNGGKMHAVVKHTLDKASEWSLGDDEVHFPKGTRPTDEQMAIIEAILDTPEEDKKLKLHGRNCAFVVHKDGSVQLFLRRMKPKKRGFDDLSNLEKSCLVPLPEGQNGGSGRYRYLMVPRDPVKHIEEEWSEIEKPETMAKTIFGNLDAIEKVYQILERPHFQRYKDKGWFTAELCGPTVMPHRFVPKGTSLGVHCEQPSVPVQLRTFDDIMAFGKVYVCEGFVVRTREGKYRKCRLDRLGFKDFDKLCAKKYRDDKRPVAVILKDDEKRELPGVFHE